MKQAACKGLTHLFFPGAGRTAAGPGAARGRGQVGVRDVLACRRRARSSPARNHEYGFWGGESEDERHAAGYRLIAPIGVRARAV